MKYLISMLIFGCILYYPVSSNAQLLKKLKEKANNALNNTLDKKVEEKTGVSTADNSNSGSTGNSSSRPGNTKGAGLKNTEPPDVVAAIDDAGKSFDSKSYSDARYSVQQALIGIELQLGRQLLKSLPAIVNGLNADTTQDKVVSTQWGWNNLTIQRIYSDGKDKQMTLTIGNNLLYSGLVNAYFNNAYAVQANANEQNAKQVKVQNNKALITFDSDKGYSLIVPVGQSSMVVWEDVNFANEDEVMSAANKFSIEDIKKSLGEK
jgi:hypothetical protein